MFIGWVHLEVIHNFLVPDVYCVFVYILYLIHTLTRLVFEIHINIKLILCKQPSLCDKILKHGLQIVSIMINVCH